MATFKVGQRVRFVSDRDRDGILCREVPIGCDGVIVRVGPGQPEWEWEWVVDVPTTPYRRIGNGCGLTEHFADSCQLAPLTDPGADAFIERIKKLGREPINVTEKVTK